MKKGFYFMIEGGEGCGKNLQAKLLAEWLAKKGFEVILTREPGGTPESEQIRNVLLNKENKIDSLTELFLYSAARADNYSKIVKPALERGAIVIKNRGWPSTFAYQGLAGGINIEEIRKITSLAIQEIIPDLIFIIDIDPEKGLEKEQNPDRFATKGLDYHQRVNQGYLKLAKLFPNFTTIIPYQENNPSSMQEKIQNRVMEIIT